MVENNKTTKADIFKIDPRNIVVVDGFNSRSNFGDIDELARQIKEQGVLNPITTLPFKDEDGVEKYQLVDGERRYRAVMKLIADGVEIARIPSLFVNKNISQEDMLIQQALRNEGKNFNEYEWGVLAQKLKDKCGLTTSEIAKKLGKNVGVVTYWFQLLDMRVELQEMVRDGFISGSDLRRVLQANDHDEDKALKELTKLKDVMVKKGSDKMSLKDLDDNSRTIVIKNTKAIKKGLDVLFKYINEFVNDDGELEIDFDIMDTYEKLKDGKTINEIFNELKQRAYSNAQ